MAKERMPWEKLGDDTLQDTIGALREGYLKRFPAPRSEKGKEAIAKQLAIWKEQRRGIVSGPKSAKRELFR